MRYTLAAILVTAWLFGVMGAYTIGAIIHVLLVAAVVLFVMALLSGRRVLAGTAPSRRPDTPFTRFG